MPELVNTGKDGFKSVSYEKLTAVLVGAIQEQQRIIDKQNRQFEELKDRIAALEMAYNQPSRR